MLDVVTYGEPLVVFIAEEAGPLWQVQHFSRSLGGAELNVARGLARLNLKVGYVSRVGTDSFGQFVAHSMRDQQIDSSHVTVDATRSTGFYLKTWARDGSDPAIEYHRRGSAASRLSLEDYDPSYFAQARHLHLSGVAASLSSASLELGLHIAEQARAAGQQRISFDPNLRPALWPNIDEMLRQLLRLADLAHWVLPGLEEGRLLTGAYSPEGIADFFLLRGADGVVVKLGAGGAYLKTAQQSFTVPAAKVENIVDTVGAGDAFTVGFISALLEGQPVARAVVRANLIAAQVIQFTGDSEGLPTRAQLEVLEGAA